MKTVYGLTNFANYSLRISMEDQWGNQEEVVYQRFKLDYPVIYYLFSKNSKMSLRTLN